MLDDYLIAQARILDNDRYLCTLFASSEEVRKKIFLIIALNSEFDSILYKANNETLQLLRLEWWKQSIEELYQGKLQEHYIIQLLSSLKGLFQKSDLIELINIKQNFFGEDFLNQFSSMKEYGIQTGEVIARLLCQAIQKDISYLGEVEVIWELTKLLKQTNNSSIVEEMSQLLTSHNFNIVKLPPDLKFLYFPIKISQLYLKRYKKFPNHRLDINRTILHYHLLKARLLNIPFMT